MVREDNVQRSLERRGRVSEPEGHTLEAISAAMADERGFVTILFPQWDLPVPSLGVQCCEDLSLSK